MNELLSVSDLSIDYRADGEWRPAVSDVMFTVERGKILGIVGESGCGKSTLARGLIRLLPENGRITSGRVVLDGVDLLALRDSDLRRYRWDRVSMVFQGAMNVLDPVFRIGAQIAEAIRQHRPVSKREAWATARRLLGQVGIEADRARSYPHELSGGMKQRVGIAMAIALEPDLVIADEPTTALDVITQDVVLGQLIKLQRSAGNSMILISHDMGIIVESCDDVAVMYAGEIVETGSVEDVFAEPAHPYTIGLVNAIPSTEAETDAVSIPGHPPAAGEWPTGCRFRSRCPFATEGCEDPILWTQLDESHGVRCIRYAERHELRRRGAERSVWERVADSWGTSA